ncbi:hypothetical protein Bca4012_056012 [Brassica carinata]
MDSNGSVVIHFEHGVDRHISTLVMKGRYEEITYSHLVDRIGKKVKINVAATKLQLSYFPLVLNNKNPCYILDDEDVLGYLMMVDKKNRRSVLHVELTEIVSENQSNEMFSMNEKNLSDARANDGTVGVGELEIVPHIQEDEFEHEKWDDGIDMSLHQEFATRDEVRDLVDKGVHSNCFEVDIMKSNPRVYILKCRGAGCRWYLRAAKLKNSAFFSIRTYKKMHTCSRGDASVMKKKKRGTPSLVASVVHADYPGKYKTPDPKTLISLVKNRLGVKVSYATALRGKNKALSDLRGNPEESFARLPSYLYMLEKMNPDTITRLEVDEKNQFKYMFFALGACIEGFKAMRQVIIMDGTHLKGVYKGVLLIATAQDPDHHHYPLAFAVVDETKASSRKYTRYTHWRFMDIAFQRHYNVIGKDSQGYFVDLWHGTCYCRCFQIDRYPCVHALAAIMARGEMAEHYCSKYYWMEQWTLAYYRTIYPVPHHSTWESSEIPEEIRSKVVFPPYVEKKKGRLQVTRFPSAGEYQRKKKKKYPPLVGENEESDSDSSESEGSESDGSGNDGTGNVGIDE